MLIVARAYVSRFSQAPCSCRKCNNAHGPRTASTNHLGSRVNPMSPSSLPQIGLLLSAVGPATQTRWSDTVAHPSAYEATSDTKWRSDETLASDCVAGASSLVTFDAAGTQLVAELGHLSVATSPPLRDSNTAQQEGSTLDVAMPVYHCVGIACTAADEMSLPPPAYVRGQSCGIPANGPACAALPPYADGESSLHAPSTLPPSYHTRPSLPDLLPYFGPLLHPRASCHALHVISSDASSTDASHSGCDRAD